MATRQPLPRDRHAAVGIGSKLYVWGGYGGSSKIKTTAVEVFDVTSLNWKQEALRDCDMPDGLQGMAVTTHEWRGDGLLLLRPGWFHML